MERESMIFYKSFFEAIKDLPPEEFKRCACALLEYGIEGKEPTENGIEKTVYVMAKPQIDKNNQRYENGKKGGRNANQTETETKPNDNQTETETKPNCKNAEPNVNVNDNVNVNVNDIYITHSAGARTCEKSTMTCAEFLKKYPNIYPDKLTAADGLDFDLLDRKFQESKKYLQGQPHNLSWVQSNYRRILADVHKDKEKTVNDNGMAFFNKITEQLKAREKTK